MNLWGRKWSPRPTPLPSSNSLLIKVLKRPLFSQYGRQIRHLLFSRSALSDSVTPRTAAHQASLSFTISRSLLKLMSIESVMPSNHLILCRPLLLPPSVCPSIRVFSKESAFCIRWPNDCSFSTSPSSEYSRLISFRMDQLDLLAVQGTLKRPHRHQFI